MTEGAGSDRREVIAVLVVGAVVLLAAAYRATLAVSFYDDTHYVTMALRIANGAVPFVDEMSLQTPGFFVPAAFVWLWTRLVGTTGLVLAYRLLYVVLAAGAAALVYRALRPSLRPAAAGMSALVPLISVPFNLVAPSYNTMAMLGSVVALASAYRACRDERGRGWAALAGAAMALAGVSYLPLSVAMATLLATMLVIGRGRRLAMPALAGAAATLVVLLGWLVPVVTIADIQRSVAYASANVRGFGSPLAKVWRVVTFVGELAARVETWPAVALAIAASLRRVPGRIRLSALIALPATALISGLVWLASGSTRLAFGTTASAWFLAFVIAALAPVSAWAHREGAADVRLLLRLGGPAALAGGLIVTYATNASLARGVPVVGVAALGVAVVAGWVAAVAELGGSQAARWAVPVLAASLVVSLFISALDEQRPLTLHATVTDGPYAGIVTNEGRREELTDLRDLAARFVRPTDRVTFLGERTGYLVTGGVPYTNAVWLYPGPSDGAALEYFARKGATPDVVFVDVRSWRRQGDPDYGKWAATDPFVAWLLERYRRVGSAADFDLLVPRWRADADASTTMGSRRTNAPGRRTA